MDKITATTKKCWGEEETKYREKMAQVQYTTCNKKHILCKELELERACFPTRANKLGFSWKENGEREEKRELGTLREREESQPFTKNKSKRPRRREGEIMRSRRRA